MDKGPTTPDKNVNESDAFIGEPMFTLYFHPKCTLNRTDEIVKLVYTRRSMRISLRIRGRSVTLRKVVNT